MIDCATATDLLLAAEPDELRGGGDSALATHLRACATCRGQAELLLAEQAQLAGALDALTSRHTAAPTRRTPRRWMPRVLVPLAAAAAAAAIVFVSQDRASDRPLPPILIPPTHVADVPIVNASTARNVAVMRTSDPKITVVWYY